MRRPPAPIRAASLLALGCLLALSACSDDGGSKPVDGIPCDIDADCARAFPELRECEAAVCSNEGVCAIGREPDGTECRDGLLCTTPDYCLEGQCTGTTLRCVDDDPCTLDTCDNKSGCYFVAQSDVGCDDLNPCTVGDTCRAGSCESGALEEACCRFDGDCADDDPCTDDRCADNACVHPPNFAPCDDGNVCTTQDHCDGEGLCGGDTVACEDGNPCTLDECNPATGACESAATDDAIPCEDGNSCTVEDLCDDSECIPGDNLCECTTDADCVPMEDTDLCNGTLRCTGLRCQIDPLTVVACNPTGDATCVTNTCDGLTGQCRPLASDNGLFCDDQNPCTNVDQCQNGLCLGVALSCDDQNPCTFDACSPVTGCQYSDNNLSCSDGTDCTVNDQCNGGVCIGVAIGCDDGNPCTQDSCDASACRSVPKAGTCDDGDVCTANDSCVSGVCTGGGSACSPCTVSADCAVFDDGDKCNGTLVCVDTSCEADPATVVSCDTASDGPCRKTRCVPATGQCVAEDVANGTSCSDGTSCTLQDECSGGTCIGDAVDCDDGNPCTNDACDAALGCRSTAHSSTCDDGNACTTSDVCTSGRCAGMLRVCNDGNECTIDSCDLLAGCRVTNGADNIVCNDDSVCTTDDHCTGGNCTGAMIQCADTNPCTNDTCVPSLGCRFPAAPSTVSCDDGNRCTGPDHCDNRACVGSSLVCDDANSCTTDACNPATGCTATALADGEPCDDGSACTEPDACDGGLCVPGEIICTGCNLTPCADPGPCKAATCETVSGNCIESNDNENGPCNDGSACSTADKCTAGTCGGAALVCNDNNPCTVDSCAPATGCTASNGSNGTACPDADLCDGSETCSNGVCSAAGTALVCNDNNPCTANNCVAATGCAYPASGNGNPCPDADKCDGAETCQNGLCTNGTAVNCNDNNTCTTDSCITATGACSHVTDPGCVPSITCNGPLTTNSQLGSNDFPPVTLVGTLGASGTGGIIYEWEVTSAPTASSAAPANPGASSSSFAPDLAGDYQITLTVTDSAGQSDSCTVLVSAVPAEDIRIELVWDTLWGDADLHLTRPGASLPGAWFSASNDCFWNNCTSGLDWGGAGSPGNPELDDDDTDGSGPENIYIDETPQSGVYTIGVSYYCEYSPGSPTIRGPANATVRVTCNGVTTEITALDLSETGVFIIVGTVSWPSCAVTPQRTSLYVGDIQQGPGTPVRCDISPCFSDDECLSGEFCTPVFSCSLDPN